MPLEELPAPQDDDAAAHLPGADLPAIELPSTDGGTLALRELRPRAVVFVHPSIGGIDEARLDQWTAIPGARGCTPEACGFRDRLRAFQAVGVDVIGLSTQAPQEQRNAVERLGLPYPLLSDHELRLAMALGLPTFAFDGQTYLKRLTLVVSGRRVEAALYPVFPPDRAAHDALAWLSQGHPAASGSRPD